MTSSEKIGLIAGSGSLPALFAKAAKAKGLKVVAAAHLGETDVSLGQLVDSVEWVKVGQLSKIAKALRRGDVTQAVMAGGISHVRAIHHLRPDWGALKVAASIRSFRDDALLRSIAGFFEGEGIRIVAATDYLKDVFAPQGHIAGPPLKDSYQSDIALGQEVATLLGKADTGQTVVVKNGHVLALEAVEGTDEAIRRGGKLGGPGAVVVKLCKPGQDERFDMPAVGPQTLEVMNEVGAKVLVIQAGKTLLLDSGALVQLAEKYKLTLVGVVPISIDPGAGTQDRNTSTVRPGRGAP